MDNLDQDVINLAKAIRQTETGNKPIRGKSGELASRYQFLPSTWKSWAGEVLGNPNAPITLENENKVAYTKIKKWKDQGYNPAQIASIWNSGGPKWEGKKGVNKQGVAYDVPLYVNKVYSAYRNIKGQPQQVENKAEPTIQDQRYNRTSQGLPVSVNPERTEPTLGGTIARDVLETPAKILESFKALPKALAGRPQAEINAGNFSKYFGKQIKPLGTGGNFGQNLKESLGAGLELSSYVPIAGSAVGGAKILNTGAKTFGKEVTKSTFKKVGLNAIEGGVGAGLFEGGKRLQGEEDRGNILENVALGTLGGGVLGLGGSVLGKGARQARRTIASVTGNIPQDIAEESTQRLSGAWTGVIDNYKDLRNFRTKQAKYGRNIEQILTDEVVVPEIIDGKLNTAKLIPNIDQKISTTAQQVGRLASAYDDFPVKLASLQQKAERVIRDTPSITATGEVKSAISELTRKMDGLKEIYGDTIVPSQLNQIRVEMNKATKAFAGDQFKQDVADAIADATREVLDEVIPDDVFRRANSKVGDLINVRKFLQKVDGKQVGGGRFSQAFAGIVGSAVGREAGKGGIPIMGPILGYLGGREVQRQARQFAFGKAGPRTRSILRKITKKNELGEELAQKTAKKEQLLLLAPTSPYRKQMSSTGVINLPQKTSSTIDKQEMGARVLERVKRGDEITLNGERLEVSLKLDDGVVVKTEDGTKKFIKKADLAGSESISGKKVYDESMSEVESLMDMSRAGYRVFDESGVGTNVKGVKSTFPKWISEDLRSKELFDRVIDKIKNNSVLVGSKEKRLYKEMREEALRRMNNKGSVTEKTLTEKANEMSFEDFEKFYNKTKPSEKIEDLKKFWEENNLGGEKIFALFPLFGKKVISEDDETKTTQTGILNGNRRIFERKNTPKELVLPKAIDNKKIIEPTPEIKSSVEKAYKKYPDLPKGFLETVLAMESSMAKDPSNKNKKIGEFAWVGGLTEIAKDTLEKAGIQYDLSTLDGAIQAVADFVELKRKFIEKDGTIRYIDDPEKLYFERYNGLGILKKWGEDKLKSRKNDFNNLLSYYAGKD